MCKRPVHVLTAALCVLVVCTGLQASDISSVEVVGGSTRVPAVFNLVQDVFGMTPSRTLNAKEVVSRGAALQCAMISPLIKVGAGAARIVVIKQQPVGVAVVCDRLPYRQMQLLSVMLFPCRTRQPLLALC
jgi:molecular chaperone DnaK (HSP70)